VNRKIFFGTKKYKVTFVETILFYLQHSLSAKDCRFSKY